MTRLFKQSASEENSMPRRYHLIGIGGIGVSCIAQILLKSGNRVSGSDIKESDITRMLLRLGAVIHIGHSSCHVHEADVVIYSSAIREDNPEIQEARRLQIPLVKRAQALAELMRDKIVITVAGSHGKTTTASLAAFLLVKAKMNPTIAIGGVLKNIDTNACLGTGNYFVAEADESDGTFLFYAPTYSIITNIDKEHLDYYKDFDSEIEAFRKFMDKTKQEGCIFCCGDDAYLKKLLSDYRRRFLRFGLCQDDDIFPKNITYEGLTSEFDCYYKNNFVDRFKISLAGNHNISNALAVIALGLELGIARPQIKSALSQFRGAHRRLDVKLEGEYTVVDDYAHHPSEIRATLGAVKKLGKRIIAVFQPHRFTRTKLLLDEFAKCFDAADRIVITDIYSAGEAPLEGITGCLILDKIAAAGSGNKAVFVPKENIVTHVLQILRPGDLVITLGAGDITNICDELVARITHKI